ncbi:hypothetical protein AGABI1DRAFT_75575 [Agaricus bisporus var. burnettii JB137-S8]|uniref:Uncharacterized protein n=1 Tax=Agaricus bisporus var. burnettii (strain JB137-S8 / ATCC MYA-4627 / FGSC 10392) TaxID=597362 RepID=K5X704_AGABU|nr:uncharacterized protein AGABI1DRAFT_75575 [Agaricus bisporus var. burnettii JB137-S8]EKM78993.1 hypothetical protein AGABI1DRAFT_75575 [Agaricus bisporus var. burnettii JB137-S8]
MPVPPSPTPVPPSPPPQLRPSGRPNRLTRRPRRYEHYTDEFPPELPAIIPSILEPPPPMNESMPDTEPVTIETPAVVFTTPPNSYGIFHTYQDGPPSYVPNTLDYIDSSNFTPKPGDHDTRNVFSSLGLSETAARKPFFEPLANVTTYRLMEWFYGSLTLKSSTELQRLVDNVILAEDFSREELLSFRATKENERLDHWVDSGTALNSGVPFSTGTSWRETSIKILIPAEKVLFRNAESVPRAEVSGLFYRRPIEVIKAALSEPLAQDFHLTPYQPSAHASHHIAYIPKLSDSFKDSYKAIHKKYPTQSVITNCRRELVHEIWLLLMDEDFVEAYKNGFTHEFFDGVIRRVFLRISIYGMDYPEKVLMSLIRYFGNFPCPRCLIPKSKICWLGTTPDEEYRINERRVDDSLHQKTVKKAWNLVHLKGKAITSKPVEELLGPTSLVPVQNAFSIRLSGIGFDFHDMIAPDFLHEFELGVWKRTFTHLLRLLASHGKGTVEKLNERYRNIPTYGNGVIQRFYSDASAMKRMAGRDYEDLLQLIFELATWHSLVKLRLHTDSTLKGLEGSTRRLGQLFRRFVAETCDVYDTRELPAEAIARGKRSMVANPQRNKSSEAKQIKFQLNTYKFHALGDYTWYIRRFGTYENFSTQIGEVEHKGVKKLFPRTQKKQYTKGIAKQHSRERLLHLMSRNDPRKAQKKTVNLMNSENLPPASPYEQHQMSIEARSDNALNVRQWLSENEEDPAIKDFLPKLRRHLFMQLIGYTSGRDEDEITDEESQSVQILNERLYSHEVFRVNYTTYDLRRTQDSINPKTHPDIMVLSPEEDNGKSTFHPYWYARIIKIFHANVYFRGSRSCPNIPAGRQIMKFLFVRWFSNETLHEHGWRNKHLPMVNFTAISDPEPFGFVNPRHVLRGSHLLPAFKFGRTNRLLPPSLARQSRDKDNDWSFYYVNIFVDRDMMMRYRGGGVGHKLTRHATNTFLEDRDPFDELDFYTEHEQDPGRVERMLSDLEGGVDWEDEEPSSGESEAESGDDSDNGPGYADL